MLVLTLTLLTAYAVNDRVYYIESKYNSDSPTMNFEQVWNTVSEQEKLFLTKHVGESAKSGFPPNLSERMRQRDSNSVEDAQYLYSMAEFIDCFPEEAPRGPIGDFFIKKGMQLLEKMDKNMLLRVDPKIFNIYHKLASFSLFDKFKEEWSDDLPAFIPEKFDIIKDFNFYEESSKLNMTGFPVTKFSKIFSYGGREFGPYTYVIDYPDYTKFNSKKLAQVLNQLSNHDSKGKVYSKVNLKLGEDIFNVASGEEFVQALYDHPDYDVIVYEARALVSFGGMVIKNGDSLTSIELPFYVKTRFEDENLYVPMNHSEHLICVYKKGDSVPLAVAEWYMAMGPDKNNRQGAYFEEALVGGAYWTGYKVTHIYNKIENIKKFITLTTSFQRFVNYVQKAYNFPDLGYGMLAVCNDSTAIIEVALSGQSAFNSVPNLRAVKFDFLYKNFMGNVKNGLKYNSKGYLNVVSDTYADVYPINRADYVKRLTMSIPFRFTDRLGDFKISGVFEKLGQIDNSYMKYLDYTYQD